MHEYLTSVVVKPNNSFSYKMKNLYVQHDVKQFIPLPSIICRLVNGRACLFFIVVRNNRYVTPLHHFNYLI